MRRKYCYYCYRWSIVASVWR